MDFSTAPKFTLYNAAKLIDGKLETSNLLQFAELDLPPTLHNAPAATIALWIFPRRAGEQIFLSRGLPEPGPNGERLFRHSDKFVNFILGTDPRIEFYEWTALIAPRPLIVGQAVGELRPHEEENHAAVREVYTALGHSNRVRYLWYAGDHDFPPVARQAAVEFFKRWLSP